MTVIKYSTEWFKNAIQSHSDVTSASERPSGHVQLDRIGLDPITVAPVSIERLEIHHVDKVLDVDDATIICVIRKTSHYMWDAREHALERGSTTQTMKELYTALTDTDPRPHLDKNVSYAVDRLEQHSKVAEVHMVCESSMEVVRVGDLDPICIAIEYEYEFSEEALVRAIKRHPDANAVLNSNPNGTPTDAALSHAKEARVGLFRMSHLRGALNYGGDSFFNYQPPKARRR